MLIKMKYSFVFLKFLMVVLLGTSYGFAAPTSKLNREVLKVTDWGFAKGQKPTALHDAVTVGSMDQVVRALESGVDINAVAFDMETALHIAVEKGYYDIAKYLLDHGADVNAKGGPYSDYETPLHYACSKDGSKTIVLLLLEYGAEIDSKSGSLGRTPLIVAAHIAPIEIVEVLVNHKANVNTQSKKGGWTPLHNAIHRFETGYPQRLKIVTLLIQSGADLNIKDNEGRTPLAFATELNDKEMVDALIKHGAN